MIHYNDPTIASCLFDGQFGLEKESLRMSADGKMAQTPHPFEDERIVRDFAENQTEIDTGVHDHLEDAIQELRNLTIGMEKTLSQNNELLWPFSSPPVIENEQQIPIANLAESEPDDWAYRQYLSSRYGRYKMVLCGIHFNFSFSEQLLQAEFAHQTEQDYTKWKNGFYLALAAKCSKYGWLINALMNASPLVDGSFWEQHLKGKTCFTGMGSLRNSALGYWNFFVPVFDYSSIEAYARSIDQYCKMGLLKAPRELYYPVRLKPSRRYSLEALEQEGVNHIELRMLDVNPFILEGIDERDARFLHLFLVWLACLPDEEMSQEEQILAEQNFKNASHYDLKTAHILMEGDQSQTVYEAALVILRQMQSFFQAKDMDDGGCLAWQIEKITHPEDCRYAWMVRKNFETNYNEKGFELARSLQQEAIQAVKPASESFLEPTML